MAVAVAAPHPAAVDAAREAVAAGGNALDAALAAAGALTVAYPHQCSVGGDLVAIVRPADGPARAVLSIGAAAQAVDIGALRAAGDEMPAYGPQTVTVPGVVAGWAAIAGLGARLPLAAVLDPAIRLAAGGVPVSPGLRRAIADRIDAVRADPGLSALLLGGTGRLVQPALAETLRTIAADWSAFYRGGLAERLVAGLRALGSPLSAADLAAHRAEIADPLTRVVGGVTWHAAPPPVQGPTFLAVLGADDLLDASLRARRLRDALLGDPRTGPIDVDALLSLADVPGVAAGPGTQPAGHNVAAGPGTQPAGHNVAAGPGTQPAGHNVAAGAGTQPAAHNLATAPGTPFTGDTSAAAPGRKPPSVDVAAAAGSQPVGVDVAVAGSQPIGLDVTAAAGAEPIGGTAAPAGGKPTGDTVAVTAVDDDGNAVTLIQSVFQSFGSGLLDPGTGIVLHNRGASFSLDPAHPGRIAPGSRPPHTLCPTLATAARTVVALGCQGGRNQPWILAQVAAEALDSPDLPGLLSRPRWILDGPALVAEPGTPGISAPAGLTVVTTDGPHDDAGHVQVCRLRDGALAAASDTRADGLAAVLGDRSS